MKRIMSLIFALLPLTLAAQTIHIVLFCATNDPQVGKTATNTKNYFVNTFIPDVKKNSGYNVVDYLYFGQNFTKSKLEQVANNLSTSSNDAIFFYYCGHGLNRPQGGDYPKLYFGNDEKWFTEVFDALQAKNHRLLVAIAEACNMEYPFKNNTNGKITTNSAPTKSESNFKKLFSASGDYICSSCKRNQRSYFDNDWGYFTVAFKKMFANEVSKSTSVPTWDHILAGTTKETSTTTDENGHIQTPQWEKKTRTSLPPIDVHPLPQEPRVVTPDIKSTLETLPGKAKTTKYATKRTDGSLYFQAAGRALLVNADGSVTVGFLKDGKFDSKARSYDKYGRIATPESFKSTNHRFGVVKTARGSVFFGELSADGKYDGIGIFIEKSGDAYIAQWSQGTTFSSNDIHYIK